MEEIPLSRAAMAPAVADPRTIEELTPLLLKTGRRLNGEPCAAAEIGAETGSLRPMEKNMRGKAPPFLRERHEIVDTGPGILNDPSRYPLCTFPVGTPEEAEEDTTALELFDRSEDRPSCVPVPFIPIRGTAWGTRGAWGSGTSRSSSGR